MPPEPARDDRESVLSRFDVSRETSARLGAYVDLLHHWQSKTNLVAEASLPMVWERHVADSLQFLSLGVHARRWVDLGSGGGFPGIVVAIGALDAPGTVVDLVESNNKKAAFLRAVVRELKLPATVHAIRIEDAGAVLARADAVSARALASLDALCGMVAGHVSPQVPCFFAKGRNHDEEIVDASRRWRFRITRHSSLGEAGAAILEVAGIEPRAPEARTGGTETKQAERPRS